MQYVYVICALAAFIRLRGSGFYAFRCFLIASAISRSFWQASPSAHWWLQWITICEPMVTVLMPASVLESGYYATTRMFPSERNSMFTVSALVALIWSLWVSREVPNSGLGIAVGIRLCAQSGIAVMALVGGAYIWIKGNGLCKLTRRHGITLIIFLCIEAAVEVVDRYIPQYDVYHWWVASTAFWCGWCACMIHWCFMPSACAEEFLQRSLNGFPSYRP